MATDKYDLHTIDYSVQGWDTIMSTDMEKLDDVIHTNLLATLGETVAAKKAVYLPVGGTKVMKARGDNFRQPSLGLTLESGVLDDEVRIQRVGPITDTGWSWATGTPVYLDPNTAGELTQTPPASNKQFMGIPISATVLILSGSIDLDSLAGGSTTSTTTSSTTTSSSTTTTA